MPRKRGRLTKEQLGNEADTQLRENAKEVLGKFWTTVKNKLDSGDSKTIEMVGRMFQYDKGPGGVTIFNQHMQVNATAAAEQGARVRSFDQIIGKLSEQSDRERESRLLAAPLENSEDDEEDSDDDEIPDAEVEDVPVGASE